MSQRQFLRSCVVLALHFPSSCKVLACNDTWLEIPEPRPAKGSPFSQTAAERRLTDQGDYT